MKSSDIHKSEIYFSIPIPYQAYTVEFSPYDWSCSLIAVGTASKVLVGQLKFEEKEFPEGFHYDSLRDFHHGTRVTAFAWSPVSSLSVIPRLIKFATAGADKRLRIFTSNLKNDDALQILDGHTDYINDLSFEPEHGNQLASVGDDHTCRIWGSDGTLKFSFTLNAPGVGVCWHKEDPKKLLVAQKNGIIRFYNLVTKQPIMSLDCDHAPLLSADWSSENSLLVGCVASSHWFAWDISRSSRPQNHSQIHNEGARHLRWCRSNPSIIATIGRPGNQIKVTNIKQDNIILEENLLVAGNLSWHHNKSVLAVAGDKKIQLWKLDIL